MIMFYPSVSQDLFYFLKIAEDIKLKSILSTKVNILIVIKKLNTIKRHNKNQDFFLLFTLSSKTYYKVQTIDLEFRYERRLS